MDQVHTLPLSSVLPLVAGSWAEKAVPSWSAKEVGSWLGSLGLGAYASAFRDRSIDGAKLVGLGRADFTALGLTRIAHRQALERALKTRLAPPSWD